MTDFSTKTTDAARPSAPVTTYSRRLAAAHRLPSPAACLLGLFLVGMTGLEPASAGPFVGQSIQGQSTPLVEVGSTAPDFSLPDQFGNPIKLSEFRGKRHVVLYFYPKAMTPGCTRQAQEIRDHKQDFTGLETVVLGISPDPASRLTQFDEMHGLDFTLLADELHEVAEKYGVWEEQEFMGRTYMGVSRVTFIIDKEGVVRHVMPDVDVVSHHTDAMRFIGEHLQRNQL